MPFTVKDLIKRLEQLDPDSPIMGLIYNEGHDELHIDEYISLPIPITDMLKQDVPDTENSEVVGDADLYLLEKDMGTGEMYPVPYPDQQDITRLTGLDPRTVFIRVDIDHHNVVKNLGG